MPSDRPKNPFLRNPAPDFSAAEGPGPRAQALAQGHLIEVSRLGQAAGLSYPVAVTAALWDDIQAVPPDLRDLQDGPRRLHRVLASAEAAMRRNPDMSEVVFPVLLPVGNRRTYTVKLVCGPGDAQEPVLTLMRPDEANGTADPSSGRTRRGPGKGPG